MEAVVPGQAGRTGPTEQLAGELPAPPAGDGRVGGHAGPGHGAAALGHAGGRGRAREHACTYECPCVAVCIWECVSAGLWAWVCEHRPSGLLPDFPGCQTVGMNGIVHSVFRGFFNLEECQTESCVNSLINI